MLLNSGRHILFHFRRDFRRQWSSLDPSSWKKFRISKIHGCQQEAWLRKPSRRGLRFVPSYLISKCIFDFCIVLVEDLSFYRLLGFIINVSSSVRRQDLFHGTIRLLSLILKQHRAIQKVRTINVH